MKKLLIALSALAFLLPTTVSAQLNVPQGGTGSTTLSGILYGIPGNLRVQTVNIGAGCTFLTGHLSCAGILSTTTALVAGQSVYATGLNTIGSVATSSLIAGTGVTFSGTPGYLIGGTNLTINASGSGTVNSGLAGDHAYYAANGTAVSATSTIFLSTAMNVGIQTATPAFPLDVTAPGTTGETVRIYSGVLPNINSAVNLAGGLTVIADGTTTNTSAFEGYSGTTGQGDGADNVFFSSRGVPGTPTDLSKNDSLGLLDFRGQYTTGVSGARARFEANAAEAWSSSTNNGTYFDWQVTPAGSATIADVMRLQSSGGLVLGNSYLTTDPGAGSEILSGKLGIGTTSPYANLSVMATDKGAAATNQYLFAIGSSTATATTTLLSVDNTGALTAQSETLNGALMMSSHAISQISTLSTNNGAGYELVTGAPSGTVPNIIPNRSDLTTGIGADTAGNLSFITAATTKLELLNNGDVGIGTTTPTAVFVTEAASSTVATTGYTGLVALFTGLENTTLKLFFAIDQWGHQITSGDTPGISGGTSSVSGNDNNGTITVTGTALTSVTLIFAHPWATAPDCTESDNSTALTADITSISTTQVVFGFSIGVNSGIVWYQCRSHQ